MGFLALATIVVVSLLIGVAVQRLETSRYRYDWLIVAASAAFGTYFASETLPGSTVFEGITNWGPSVDGFVVIPGIVVGALVAIVAYFGTRESFELQTAT